MRSHWADAAADYAKVIRNRPVADHEIVEYACVLLVLGDVNGYQQYCKDLAARPGEPHDAVAAMQMARACAVGPVDAVDVARIVDWAEQAVQDERLPWRLHTLGLAHYRAGQFDLAIENLKEANGPNWGKMGRAQNWLVLAMTHQRLGHFDEAQQCLETARQLIAQFQPKKPDDPVEVPVPDWIDTQVLSREAEAQLKEPMTEPKTTTTDHESKTNDN